MREVLGRVLSALRVLKPKINNTGAGSVQVGKAGGAVRIVNVTQHQPVAHHGAVTNVQVTQHIYSASPPPTPAVSSPGREATRFRPPLSASHREVLALLDGLPQRITVLDFMEREFNTRMVIDLTEPQIYRTRRYVETIRKANSAPKGRSKKAHHHEFL